MIVNMLLVLLSKLSPVIRLGFTLAANLDLWHLDWWWESHVSGYDNALHDAIAHYEVQNFICHRVWKLLVLGPCLSQSCLALKHEEAFKLYCGNSAHASIIYCKTEVHFSYAFSALYNLSNFMVNINLDVLVCLG